ncbi:DJ-1 family glyoxalase III [Pontiella agarivorans]|uniref:DJ-1/PfpI family protein n=1 Tax=Pontiella agarivorans TaxID=3038953 RepID=A0ABU5MYY2_9BACT|nr:DJ-1 family glyoxalase III [Pontiella agarivorans]MDZ8119425.1 DJ-1/PfpI family protein [Pontiella agarivorans]
MNVLVPIANGSEEMEAVIIIDTLRRAEFEVTVAGLTAGTIEASRGVKLVPDTTWELVDPADFDVLLLPGGFGGTEAFMAHAGVQQALKDFDAAGKWFGCICAAALALNEAGVLEGKRFTCYPGVEQKLPPNVQPERDPVVVDGHLITSQGPGTAFEFALKVIAECGSPNLADEVRAGLLL